MDIDSIEEFPRLNSTKVNDSCSACPTIFDDTPILRNAEASEAEYQASEPEEAISPQIHFAADAEPEIQTPQSLDKHFDLSLPQRCTSDSPLHDDLLAFETESSGASEPENLEESCLKNLPNGNFLDLDQLIDIFSTGNHEILNEIPRCKKENIFFLLDNSENLKRKASSKRMEFWDNCGTWDSKSSSTKTTYFFYFDDKLTTAIKKQSQFGRIIKKQFVPFDPQPLENQLFILKRFYATLKRDKQFKKRISWFEQMPGNEKEFKTLAVVEYLGTFPEDEVSKHGNARKTNQEYVRTSPKTKENILAAVKTNKTAREIFKENFNSDHPPRDTKMIHNIKEKLQRENNPGHRQNNADDIQAILNLTAVENPFVREIVQLAGKPPNIICYTDNQLKLLAKASRTSVIGIDRTFNLGPCFVTTTVFQDRNLKRKGKEVSPILLGPMYLHWDGTFHTYQRFFSHLSAVIDQPLTDTELGVGNLIVGSDEEKALVKAIKSSFCEAKLTLCTRHLEENLKRQLKNKIGMPDKESKQIGNEIFGPDGLISLDTTVSFAEKACDLEQNYKDKVGPYLTEKLIPTIKEHVFKIYKSDTRLPLNWKNNHCEAMNHILKLNLNWKPAKNTRID